MRLRLGAIIIWSVAAVVSGCADRGLHDLRSNSAGPDEFMVLPVKPLTAPRDYDVLPAPTPGGGNLVDPNPRADAVASLGGRPAALNPGGGIPAADNALVAQASRHGVEQNVRSNLAQEDAKFRKRQGRLSSIKLFRVDRYEQAYRNQKLNPFGNADRFRGAGVATPTSPPGS